MSQITIQKTLFTVPVRYSAGHVLTEGEAGALNQTYHENLRNNFAKNVKDGIAAGVPVATLQSQLDTYAAEYQFGVRRAAAPAVTEAMVLLAFAKNQGYESIEDMQAALAKTPVGKRRAA